MLRLLQSPWAALAIGLLSYLGTTLALWRTPVSESGAEPKSTHGAAKNAEASWNFKNPEVDQLLVELRKEKEALAQRAQQLNELSARLQTERLELNQVTQKVAQMQQEFDQHVVRVREEETANLKKLAKVYAGMTPDGAITILKELPDDQIVKILIFMKESESAPLLENLGKGGDAEAKRAALISERIRLSLPRATNSKARTP
jgi:flagellar motility protein MotE (MotC chaperone)